MIQGLCGGQPLKVGNGLHTSVKRCQDRCSEGKRNVSFSSSVFDLKARIQELYYLASYL
jgi:hypothetical protein